MTRLYQLLLFFLCETAFYTSTSKTTKPQIGYAGWTNDTFR